MATATANFTTGITLILAATLLLAFPLTAAQSMAPAPVSSDDCSSHLTNVSDCLTYVEAQSNLTKPDKGCCPEFAGLVDSHPICLCELLKNANSFGIQINVSKALMLPSVCGVTTPPLSACSGSRSINLSIFRCLSTRCSTLIQIWSFALDSAIWFNWPPGMQKVNWNWVPEIYRP